MPPLPQRTRPKTCEPPFKAILSFPLRLCHPPPSAGVKRQSFGVFPVLQVHLDDVLNRKHLPPLSLKDFEEWLLYVEASAENLYFHLWLKDYTVRYKLWVAQPGNARAAEAPHLAMFYTRAKELFLTPNAKYELHLPMHYLSLFHEPGMLDQHPDPANFTQLALETESLLEQSLQRFLPAQLGNVGNSRALCAKLASPIVLLVGAVLPLMVIMTLSDSWWLRPLSFPGFWLGLTVFICALHKICLGVYIFGDFRQLRRYELARPKVVNTELQSILNESSDSVPSVTLPHRPVIPPPLRVRNGPTHPLYRPPSISSVNPPNSVCSPLSISSVNPPICVYSPPSISSVNSPNSFSSPHSSSAHFQAATSFEFVETNLLEGTATWKEATSSADECDENTLYKITAPFIHPFDADDDPNSVDLSRLPEECQHLASFDFDTLPPRLYEESIQGSKPSSVTKIIAWLRNKCPTRHPLTNSSQEGMTHTPTSSFGAPFPFFPYPESRRPANCPERAIRSRLRKIKAVPALSVPWTRVLSPVIRRGQWEIVIRSACYAFLVSCIVVGAVIAIPVQ